MKNWIIGAAAIFIASPALADPLLLVGNKGENTVSFINLETGEEIARKPVSGDQPHEIASSPDGSQFAVVNYGDNDIDIFDVATRTRLKTIDLGSNRRPHGLIWLDDDRILATTEASQTIVIVDKDRDVRSIKTHRRGTHMLAVSPDASLAFTADMGSGTVTRIELETGDVISAKAGAEPEGIAITPDGQEVWVSSRGDDRVRIYAADTLEKLATIEVGRFPLRIILSPDGRYAVTSDLRDGALSVIDTDSRKVVRTIPVSGSQQSGQVTLLFSDDGARIYAAETGTNTVAEVDFDSGTVLRRFSVGTRGDGLAIVPGKS